MKTSLNDRWEFIEGFQQSYLKSFPKAKDANLPHSPVELPEEGVLAQNFYGTWTYRRQFDCPDATSGRHILVFEGAMLKVRVYFNKVDLGEQVSGYNSVYFELSKHIKAKGNELIVVLSNNPDPDVAPHNGPHDYIMPPGLYRPVYLLSVNSTYIKDLFAYGDGTGTLHISYELDGPERQSAKASFRLLRRGRLIEEFEQLEKTFTGVSLYMPETPEMYELEMNLETKDGHDSKTVRFGFRDSRFTEEGFYFNQRKIFLVGLNRHQLYPYVGAAMPKASQYEDAYLLKRKLGCNVVRTSHYHQSEDFLDACDELGLFVISEIPGWNYLGNSEAWKQDYYRNVELLVKQERNHPCLIAYGLRIDESPDDDELYCKGNEIMHRLDPYRQSIGVRNFPTSHCLDDIYGFNDFSLSSLKQKRGILPRKKVKGAKGLPLLITEHNGHMFPTGVDDSPSRQAEQGLRHLKIIDTAMGTKGVAGAIGWCGIDYPSEEGFGNAMNHNLHGVMDQFRNPKEAAWAYAAENLEIPVLRVVADFNRWSHEAMAFKPIVAFSNCDYIEQYKDGKLIHVYSPDRKHYPHLKHPPFIMDRFVEASYQPAGYSKKEARKLRKLLNLMALKGEPKGKELIPYLWLALKKGLNRKTIRPYYDQTIGSYHESEWCFRGIKNGLPVIEKTFGRRSMKQLFVDMSKDTLASSDTYDTIRVSLRCVDQYGTTLEEYSPVVLSLEGPMEVIGPSIINFRKGKAGFYIKNQIVSRPCVGVLKIKTRFGEKEEIIKIY